MNAARPEPPSNVTTDYIFSVGEERLRRALVLFALFTFLLFRGIPAASLAQDPFGGCRPRASS
jgi:cell division protein FtsW (lipid II flippase)